MPLTPLDAITIAPHLVATLRKLATSLRKRSDGGKRITPAEAKAIAEELRALGDAVLRAVVD